MRNNFRGFYPPTDSEYRRLWEEGLVILDTNVLLDLYRLPSSAREEIVNVLNSIKDRLWIPHQVALEFQRNRLDIIAKERDGIEGALSAIGSLMGQVKDKVTGLQLDRRGLGIESDALLAEVESVNAQLSDALKIARDKQLEISSSDPLREQIDELFAGRVGVAPSQQAELDALILDGEERYEKKIPPGFADSEKGKNPAESVFYFDSMSYQRKFGDLILWRQIVRHVRENKIKSVIFVTADRKEDWWWRVQGKTMGPQPELIREIQKEGAVELFWMYLAEHFVGHAREYLKASVSEESMAEIKSISDASDVKPLLSQVIELGDRGYPDYDDSSRISKLKIFNYDRNNYEKLVINWLTRSRGSVEHDTRLFPSIIVRSDGGRHGYDIEVIADISEFDEVLDFDKIYDKMIALNNASIKKFSIVLVISEVVHFNISRLDLLKLINLKFSQWTKELPFHSIVVGLQSNGRFEFLGEGYGFGMLE